MGVSASLCAIVYGISLSLEENVYASSYLD